MVEKLVNYIVSCQISAGKIAEDESGVYQYGYTLFFEKLINIAIIIGICLVTNRWLEIWSFLFAIIPLRSFAGGWHAKKFWQCATISNLIVILMLLIINNISAKNEIIYIIVEIIVLIVMLTIMPVQNINKPLTTKELHKYKKVTILIWVIECCLMLVFMVYKMYIYSLIILCSHIVIVIAALAGAKSRRRSIKM